MILEVGMVAKTFKPIFDFCPKLQTSFACFQQTGIGKFAMYNLCLFKHEFILHSD